jgi:uncharacterized membrane protein YwzB
MDVGCKHFFIQYFVSKPQLVKEDYIPVLVGYIIPHVVAFVVDYLRYSNVAGWKIFDKWKF